jgi:hypothetical protein
VLSTVVDEALTTPLLSATEREQQSNNQQQSRESLSSRVSRFVLGREALLQAPRELRRPVAKCALLACAFMLGAYLLALFGGLAGGGGVCIDLQTQRDVDCPIPVERPPFYVRPADDPTRSYVTPFSMTQCFPSFVFFNVGFALGLCLFVFLLCDALRWRVVSLHNMFDAFGRNSLVSYYLHFPVKSLVHNVLPRDAPGWVVLLAWAMSMSLLFLCMAHLRKHKLFISV